MSTSELDIVELAERQTAYLDQNEENDIVGNTLFQRYSDKVVDVEFPSPKTNQTWRLSAQDWVGFIPVSQEVGVRLAPKVPFHNLFRMLEYAYNLDAFQFDSTFHSDSIKDFYEQLAVVLAKRILRRSRQGFHKEYVGRSDWPPYIRGQIDVTDVARAPWKVKHLCHYEEHTLDIRDNQILAWTLFTIARSGIRTRERLNIIRRAFHSLQGLVTIQWIPPEACLGRVYTRLNADYEPLHALCRFFLENTGPIHKSGNQKMVPFLIYMPRLFELFVAEWLQQHLPPEYSITPQERYPLGEDNSIHFDIDLVLRDVSRDKILAVLDTKYKAPDQPSADDVSQVIAYAEALGTENAFLIYPQRLNQPISHTVGDIHVQSLAFPLAGNFEEAGQEFQQRLLHQLSPVLSH